MSPTKTEANREKPWDVAAAAEYLGFSQDWVYKAAARGELPHRKVGRKLRFLPSELEAWVSRQPGATSAS